MGEQSTHDNCNIEDHIGNIRGVIGPERVDKLCQRATKGVCQAHKCRRSYPPSIGEPQVRISRRRREHKWLSKAGQQLPKHHPAKASMGAGSRSTISNPVSQKDQDGGCDNGRPRPAPIQREDDNGRYEDEGEQEGGAEPVDGRFRDGIVLGDGRRVGREGEPL